MTFLSRLFLFARSIVSPIFEWFGAVLGPRIDAFEPQGGWPGTIVTITGDRFAEDRDANVVTIGGTPALIIEAERTRLPVLAGLTTKTGSIQVTAGGKTVATAGLFTVLPQPVIDDPSQSGPPRFFSGPQYGTPQLGVKDLPVLVIPAYPADHDPSSPAARASLRNDLIQRFNQAGDYWREMSYNKTSWAFTYTNWVPLPRDRRFYV
jgi:hypothetical protein